MGKIIVKLENKEVILKGAKGAKSTYFFLSLECLKNTGIDGVNLGVMRERFKIIDKFEELLDNNEEDSEGKSFEKFIELTKSELVNLISCVKTFSWGFIDKEFLNYEDYLNDLNS